MELLLLFNIKICFLPFVLGTEFLILYFQTKAPAEGMTIPTIYHLRSQLHSQKGSRQSPVLHVYWPKPFIPAHSDLCNWDRWVWFSPQNTLSTYTSLWLKQDNRAPGDSLAKPARIVVVIVNFIESNLKSCNSFYLGTTQISHRDVHVPWRNATTSFYLFYSISHALDLYQNFYSIRWQDRTCISSCSVYWFWVHSWTLQLIMLLHKSSNLKECISLFCAFYELTTIRFSSSES